MTTAPTLTELYQAISSDFKQSFSINSENDLKRTLIALASSNAGMLKLFYLALLDVQKNIYPDLADSENNGGTLERFGRVKLGRDPYPATQGIFKITVTGTIGAEVAINTQFKKIDENSPLPSLYTATETVVLTATTGLITIISDKSGTDYNLAVGDELYSVNPINNISSLVVVSSVETEAIDEEDIEDYRELVLKAFRLEPNGGSNSDYVAWALDVEGIRTVYPYTTAGVAGTATVYAEATVSASTDGRGTPSQVLMNALWTYDKTGVFELDPDITQSIYNRGRRQLGLTEINILPVNPVAVNITLTNLKNKSVEVKVSIVDELKKMLFYKRPFIVGVGDINNKKDTLYMSDIIVALQNAIETGNTYDNVSATCNGLPLPFIFLNGNIPYINTITYV